MTDLRFSWTKNFVISNNGLERNNRWLMIFMKYRYIRKTGFIWGRFRIGFETVRSHVWVILRDCHLDYSHFRLVLWHRSIVGFDSHAKLAHNKNFTEFGSTYKRGDTIGCFLDLTDPEKITLGNWSELPYLIIFNHFWSFLIEREHISDHF